MRKKKIRKQPFPETNRQTDQRRGKSEPFPRPGRSHPLTLNRAEGVQPTRPLGTGVLPNWRISPRAELGNTCHSTRRFTATSSPAC